MLLRKPQQEYISQVIKLHFSSVKQERLKLKEQMQLSDSCRICFCGKQMKCIFRLIINQRNWFLNCISYLYLMSLKCIAELFTALMFKKKMLFCTLKLCNISPPVMLKDLSGSYYCQTFSANHISLMASEGNTKWGRICNDHRKIRGCNNWHGHARNIILVSFSMDM